MAPSDHPQPSYHYRHGLVVLRQVREAPAWMTFDPRADAYVAPGYRYPELRMWATERGIPEGREAGSGHAALDGSHAGQEGGAGGGRDDSGERPPGGERATPGEGDATQSGRAPAEPLFFDPRTPREYQAEALNRWTAAGGRGSVVLPTGAGKSFVAILAMARGMARGLPELAPPVPEKEGRSRRPSSPTRAVTPIQGACVVAPTRALLGQWFAQLADAFGAERVGAFYGDEKDHRAITVTTYHSAFNLLERWGDRFQLLILDEVHHLADTTRGEAKGWHDALRIAPAPYRLGLTATYPDGRDSELMRLVGPPVYRRRISEMVDAELADFCVERRFVALDPVEEDRYRRAHETYEGFMALRGYRKDQRDPESAWKAFMAETHRSLEARRAFRAYLERERIVALAQGKLREAGRILRLFPAERAILFCGSAVAAEELSRRFALPLITANTPASERRRILAWVEDGTVGGVVSVRVLDEGWDVPAAKVGIVLGDTTRGGRRQHVQRLGRLLRRQGDQVASLFEIVAAGTHEFFSSQKRGAGLRQARDRQLGLGL
jgi:superfamily II DNA or RNA helicase